MSGTIVERLSGTSRICIDSVIFIYFMEENNRYLSLVRSLFQMVNGGDLTGLSSYMTLLEVLVQPMRLGRQDIARRYREILLNSRSFFLFPVDREIAEAGARIRADYGFRTPDSVQLATALCKEAEAFITNDAGLKRFRELQVIALDDCLS